MSSHAAGHIDHHHDPSTSTGIPNKKLMFWAFLASDCMFFGTLISTHLVYRQHPPEGTHDPTKVFDISLTSFSTFILLMSSLMMALAVNAIQRGNVRATRSSLLVTIFFGLIFLGCQVFEFTDFVYLKEMTLTNSIFGSTFFTLTGTHGTHVAIGVLWLGLMYVRSFKPAGARGSGWLVRQFAHVLVFAAAAALMFIFIVPGVLHLFISGHTVADFFSHNAKPLIGEAVALALLWVLARPRGPVDFDERHAIDVESMGLYWHFVDIVWIVIFTAVYLLEYL
jgi:cytochrome o ubiquinol oxidase subunit 3